MAQTPVLTPADLDEALRGLPHWKLQAGQIERTVKAPSFPEAVRLVQKVADFAEEANHHPDIDIRWVNVTFRLSTHDSGGITAKDIDLARRIDEVAP